MLPSDPSLAMRLAMRNAFILRAPKAASADSAGSKPASAITPLGVVGERPGTGGALTRFCDNDDMEARQRLPRALSAGCYRGWGSRAICPLYMIKGVQVRVFLRTVSFTSRHRGKHDTIVDVYVRNAR